MDSKHLITSLEQYLFNKQYEQVLQLLQNKESLDVLQAQCGDILQQVTKLMSQPHLDEHEEKCYEDVLNILANNISPEVILLDFLEQLEEAKNDLIYINIIDCLKIINLKLTNKKLMALEWCLNSLEIYLDKIPTPAEQNLEGDEKILLNASDDYNRLTPILETINNFFKPFVKEALDNNAFKNLLTFHLFEIIGKFYPFIYFDFEKPTNLFLLCNDNVAWISSLNSDPFRFLSYFDNKPSEDDLDLDLGAGDANQDRNTKKIQNDLNKTSLGVYYYFLLKQKALHPLVYDKKYLFISISKIVLNLLNKNHNLVTKKGLELLEIVVNPLDNLQFEDLKFDIIKQIFIQLNNVMIYSKIKENRLLALKLFKQLIILFDDKGCYYVLINLRKCVTHSGTLGYLIMLIKEIIIKDKENNYFHGKLFYDLIKIYCSLIDGAKTDLVADADQIISTLNFYRFVLVQEDKRDLKQFVKDIENNFINVLKEAITLSKAHYELALKDPESLGADSAMEVCVDHNVLPQVTNDDKRHCILVSLNAIDLIDSLLCRLMECVPL